MNGWDLATWLSAAGLALSSVVIFVLFLRDARGILGREDRERDREWGE
jgi:hypothetical protein